MNDSTEINYNICKNELIQRCQVNKVKSLHCFVMSWGLIYTIGECLKWSKKTLEILKGLKGSLLRSHQVLKVPVGQRFPLPAYLLINYILLVHLWRSWRLLYYCQEYLLYIWLELSNYPDGRKLSHLFIFYCRHNFLHKIEHKRCCEMLSKCSFRE